jgi:hypothetical protein
MPTNRLPAALVRVGKWAVFLFTGMIFTRLSEAQTPA